MYSQIFEEGTGNIIISASFRIIGQMQRNTEVKTEHKNIHVVTDAYACPQGYLFRESFQTKLRIRTCLVLAQQPDVTRIQESSSPNALEDTETILYVRFETERTCLVEIRILAVFRVIATGTNTTHRKSTDTVGTTNVELFTIWGNRSITVCKKSA